MTNPYKVNRIVSIWLAIGVFMVFMQIIIGGITRLTGSGLSITEWEIVTGTLPPMNTADWEEEFVKYQATPQYEKINKGMTLKEFKFIYFWEYFHRLWARSMGIVFAIPFFIFLGRRMLSKQLVRRLVIIIAMAGVVASFGWIMVASGLIDRPWVSAYKLTMHLSLALILFSYLLWTLYLTLYPKRQVFTEVLPLKKMALGITILIGIQIIFGGLMAGTHAALVYPSFPDMNGEIIPAVLFDGSLYTAENFVEYERSVLFPTIVQVLHRGMAYILTAVIIWFFVRARKYELPRSMKVGVNLLLGMLIVQFLLGVMTIMKSIGTIPVSWGVIHQGGAIVLLSIALYINFWLYKSERA